MLADVSDLSDPFAGVDLPPAVLARAKPYTIADLDAEGVDFLFTLFAPYAEANREAGDLTVNLRFLGRRSNDVRNRHFPLDAPGLLDAVWAGQTAARTTNPLQVYMGVLPRVGGGLDSSALRFTAWLFVDIDGGNGQPDDARRLLAGFVNRGDVPPPQMMVNSGGGVHAYWQLSGLVRVGDREGVERVRTVHRRLGSLIGSAWEGGPHACPAAIDPARILRLPGTVNYKPWFTPEKANFEKPRRVRLIHLDKTDTNAKPLTWWERNLPALKRKVYEGSFGKGVPGTRSPGELFPATALKMAHAARDGEKHQTCKEVATACRKAGWDMGAICGAIEQVKQVSGVPYDTYDEKHRTERLAAWVMDNVQPGVQKNG